MQEENDYRIILSEIDGIENIIAIQIGDVQYDPEPFDIEDDIEKKFQEIDDIIAQAELACWEGVAKGPGVYVFKNSQSKEYRCISQEYIDKLFEEK